MSVTDLGAFKDELLERFIRYVKIWTTADSRKAGQGIQPSSDGQKELAALLQSELLALGVDAHVTGHGYVCGRMSASKGCENAPAICYSAHLDTSEAAPGKDVIPVITKNYDGRTIKLNTGVSLDPAKDAALAGAAGQTIIHSDGATLLGADDKAGIAVIMTALAVLQNHPEIPHGEIEAVFSPDEETGHGMDNVPLDWMKAKHAYTLDGDVAPLLEIECFNAYKTEVTFTGISRHTGAARPDMVNAVNLAADFTAMLPRHESPETTDKYLGFYAPMHICGNQEVSSVEVIVRDFDSESIQQRLKTLEVFARAVSAKYRGSSYEIKHTRQYANMREGIEKDPRSLDLLIQAEKNAGLEPAFKPIRGGTDGSRLTEMGIPAPNIFTGAHNFHSRTEWASLEQMSLSVSTLVELAALWSRQ